MKKYIIITTIHPLSTGILQFARFNDWQIVLVGDKKSVEIDSSKNITFLSVEDQFALKYDFVNTCPFNHYARKNIGYLYAIQRGADVIYDTDDDNVPYEHWGVPEFFCDRQYTSTRDFVNVYQYFSKELVWPRGFPLDEIYQEAEHNLTWTEPLNVGVWQGLANIDPDVDAVFRLIFRKEITFNDKPPIVLRQGNYCPFNSQNTIWHRKAFPYLYLPSTTSFRFTDILRGYVAQKLMWEQNLHVGFTRATVYQDRNKHDLMKDFADEIEGYLCTKPIVELLQSLDLGSDPYANLEGVYQALAGQGFVGAEEFDMCKAWIRDLKNVMNNSTA